MIKTTILVDGGYYRRKIVSSTGHEDPATAMDSLIDNPRNPNRPALRSMNYRTCRNRQFAYKISKLL